VRKHIKQLAPQREKGQHPGLLLTRFLAKNVAGDNGDPEEKRDLFKAACQASRSDAVIALYCLAFKRWRDSAQRLREVAELTTPPHARLIVGLGNKGVIESGLRLHHTYGVPLIPGSALKGLASHYCHEIWGKEDDRYKRDWKGNEPFHTLLFGKTEDSGVIRFEDAWMHPDSLGLREQGLLADVMTPHHQKWQTDENIAPTDFDSPIPVPFLSVAGRFHVAISWQGPEDTQAAAWTKRAMELLKTALADWGAGGKTSSGYGRLIVPLEVPVANPGSTASAQQTATTPPTSGKPTLQSHGVGQKVKVKVLAPHPSGGKNCFRVQEEGKAAGILQAGNPPKELPKEGEEVQVYTDNTDLRSPRYRWDMPTSPQKPAPRQQFRR
jgi:CRISPR-associated protein Cmr6